MRDLQMLASEDTVQPKREEWGMRAARPRPTGRANRLAVFGLFCAFVVPVLGIVFGIVALNEIEDLDTEERGAGMAKWAIGLGVLNLALAVAAIVWLVAR